MNAPVGEAPSGGFSGVALAAVRAAIEAAPRAVLMDRPTPLQPLPRLSEHLGADLWVKRDDLGATGLGGNKLRKLEFLLGDALTRGADSIITFGALQSNHARQTAAACARLGLRCHLVLSAAVDRGDALYLHSGNVLLDQLFDASVHLCRDEPDDRDRAAREAERDVADAGGRARSIPAGGSEPIGCLGYVAAGLEMHDQCLAQGVHIGDVVLASATGGTQSGLLAGLGAAGSTAQVTGVAVYQEATTTAAVVDRLVEGIRDLLAASAAVSPDLETASSREDAPSLRVLPTKVIDGFRGQGYGVPTEEMREAVSLLARLEGIVVDPVYSGKAAAALVEGCRSGLLGARGTTVLVHTGGSPGVFAYGRDAFA